MKKNYRIPAFYVFFAFLILIVYGAFLYLSIAKPKYYRNPVIYKKEIAVRGTIYTKNYKIAKSEKYYGVYVYPYFIAPDKKNLFYNLFSVYSGIPVNVLKQRVKEALSQGIKRVLIATVDLKTKQNLIYLRRILDNRRVFLAEKKTGIRRGYDIVSLNFKRVYPYNDTLEPVLGRYRADIKRGDNGLEEYYDNYLRAKKNGYEKGYRDVLGNIIYDGNAIIKHPINGNNLRLNINLVLQREIEKLLSRQKKKYNAKEVVAAVMDSKSGKIIAIASSNRYNPNDIRKQDIPNMRISVIREIFEPGSVMKPITFAILLEHNKVNPYEIIKGYNGHWKPKWRKTPIIDDKPFPWLSAEQVLIYSSNIGISQLVLRLSGMQFWKGLRKFGFGMHTGIDLPYEIKGYLRSPRLLQYPVYETTTAYGYGILVNFVQLLKAYNTFNNYGIEIAPKIADVPTTKKRVISAKNAEIMLHILRKVVLKGTAQKAIVPGIFTAGKTGTAHLSANGKGYLKHVYNASFFGFADDSYGHRYTIGVTFFGIKAKWPNYFASESAVPTFKKIVDIMINQNLLRPGNAK
jgi:cell division protein FtsI (penicillin-binding protein 3)